MGDDDCRGVGVVAFTAVNGLANSHCTPSPKGNRCVIVSIIYLKHSLTLSIVNDTGNVTNTTRRSRSRDSAGQCPTSTSGDLVLGIYEGNTLWGRAAL